MLAPHIADKGVPRGMSHVATFPAMLVDYTILHCSNLLYNGCTCTSIAEKVATCDIPYKFFRNLTNKVQSCLTVTNATQTLYSSKELISTRSLDTKTKRKHCSHSNDVCLNNLTNLIPKRTQFRAALRSPHKR